MMIKDIFFSTQRFFSVLVLFLLILISGSDAFCQITSGTINPDEKKENRKDEKKDAESISGSDSLTGTNFYISGLFQYAYRSFEDNSPTGTYYADWERQTAAFSGGANAGILIELTDFIQLDLGVSYFGHGENYTYADSLTDSTYSYRNNYVQFALPMRLRMVYGDKIQLYAFAGIAPLNILKIRYKSDYKTEAGKIVERETENITTGFTTFNVMFSAGFGVIYNLNRVGFFLAPEYRRNLINTYGDKIISMDHKMFGYGINAGMILKF